MQGSIPPIATQCSSCLREVSTFALSASMVRRSWFFNKISKENCCSIISRTFASASGSTCYQRRKRDLYLALGTFRQLESLCLCLARPELQGRPLQNYFVAVCVFLRDLSQGGLSYLGSPQAVSSLRRALPP